MIADDHLRERIDGAQFDFVVALAKAVRVVHTLSACAPLSSQEFATAIGCIDAIEKLLGSLRVEVAKLERLENKLGIAPDNLLKQKRPEKRDLENCRPDEIVEAGGRYYTLGEVVRDVAQMRGKACVLVEVSRDTQPSPLNADDLADLADRPDFQDYLDDTTRQALRH